MQVGIDWKVSKLYAKISELFYFEQCKALVICCVSFQYFGIGRSEVGNTPTQTKLNQISRGVKTKKLPDSK